MGQLFLLFTLFRPAKFGTCRIRVGDQPKEVVEWEFPRQKKRNVTCNTFYLVNEASIQWRQPDCDR